MQTLSSKKAFLIEVSGGACEGCREYDRVLELDHKLPVKRGGNNSIFNLQVLCKPCHHGKSYGVRELELGKNATDAEWRAVGAPQRFIKKNPTRNKGTSRTIQVRFPADRYADLQREAKAMGITPSTYVRFAGIQKLDRERTRRIVEVD